MVSYLVLILFSFGKREKDCTLCCIASDLDYLLLNSTISDYNDLFFMENPFLIMNLFVEKSERDCVMYCFT